MSEEKAKRRPRLKFLQQKQFDASAGTLVHLGERTISQPKITIVDYNYDLYQEIVAKKVEDCFPFRDRDNVSWINISGMHDVELLQRIGQHFNIHPMTLEDILNTTQRPKFEDHGTHLFVAVKLPCFDKTRNELTFEQCSFVISRHYLISFQESDNSSFDPIRERIRNGRGRIRRLGTDYLAYALLHNIITSFFTALEQVELGIQRLDDMMGINQDPEAEAMEKAQLLKRELFVMRGVILPIREVANTLLHTDSDLINESIEIFLRDLYDDTLQVADALDTSRVILDDMIDIYISALSFRMNEIMKFFTVITSVFIPLTFVASIYGMNFKSMPELDSPWGYPSAIGAMLLICLAMLVYFRKKRWI